MCFGSGNVNFPDPNEVGQAQFTWNNMNQYTPYGSMEYSAPTFDAFGNVMSPGSMNQTLSPEMAAMQEQMFGLRTGAMSQLAQLLGGGNFSFGQGAGGGGGGVGGRDQYGYNRPNTPFGGSWNSMTGDHTQINPKNMNLMQLLGGGMGGVGGIGGGGPQMFDPGMRASSKGPEPVGGYNPNQRYATDPGMTPPVGDETGPYGDWRGSFTAGEDPNMNTMFYSDNAPALKYGFNMGSLPGLLGAGDLQGERQRVEQGLYDRRMGLLDPQFAQQDAAFEQEMANRGLPVGSEEYNERYQLLKQSQNEGRQAAAGEALAGGMGELQGLAGLSAQQRGQLFGEQGTQMGFSNQARQQAFGENMGVRDMLFRNLMGMGQLGLQQEGQSFGQLASILGLSAPPGAGGDLSQFYGPTPFNAGQAYGMNMQGQMHNAGNQITGGDLFSGLLGLGGAFLGGGGWR